MSPKEMLDEDLLSAARARLEAVESRIAEAASRADRSRESITLMGVSKRQPEATIAATVLCGIDVLGENYLQELQRKRPLVEDLLERAGHPRRPEWHMIGQLQRNKAKVAVECAAAVDTVDREPLARALARRAEAAGVRLRVLVQVNLSEEPQKGGCLRGELDALTDAVLEEPALALEGLMTVPAATDDPEQSRPAFADLRRLAESLRSRTGLALPVLSMGMSADLEVAIEEGATLVRVGTALFGARSA